MTTAPDDVRVHYADGTTSDELPTIYLGVDDEGTAVWEAMLPDDREPVRLTVASLPARTTVLLVMPW